MAQSASKRASKPEQTQATWSHGSFHWNELMTRDVERAKRENVPPEHAAHLRIVGEQRAQHQDNARKPRR